MTVARIWLSRVFVVLLYACAGLQFVRFYAKNTDLYLHLPAYLAGNERMPFQERVLPILFLRPMFHSAWFMGFMSHTHTVAGVRAPFYVLSLLGFTIAALCTQLLYRAVSTRNTLAWLVFPIFLFTVMWTYTVHVEANFSYPYDMLSLAFFTAGMLFIYQRRFWPLLLIVLIGTWNRETTLFLICVFAIDAMSTGATGTASLSQRLHLQRFPWRRAGLLFAIWLAIKLWLGHHFHGNNQAENYVRLFENMGRVKLRLLPALLNICGYLFPLVLLLWRRITPARFGNYVWVAVPWMLVMFYTGVILETRIYGELCSYTAVALVLLAEQQSRMPHLAEARRHRSALEESHAELSVASR